MTIRDEPARDTNGRTRRTQAPGRVDPAGRRPGRVIVSPDSAAFALSPLIRVLIPEFRLNPTTPDLDLLARIEVLADLEPIVDDLI